MIWNEVIKTEMYFNCLHFLIHIFNTVIVFLTDSLLATPELHHLTDTQFLPFKFCCWYCAKLASISLNLLYHDLLLSKLQKARNENWKLLSTTVLNIHLKNEKCSQTSRWLFPIYHQSEDIYKYPGVCIATPLALVSSAFCGLLITLPKSSGTAINLFVAESSTYRYLVSPDYFLFWKQDSNHCRIKINVSF